MAQVSNPWMNMNVLFLIKIVAWLGAIVLGMSNKTTLSRAQYFKQNIFSRHCATEFTINSHWRWKFWQLYAIMELYSRKHIICRITWYRNAWLIGSVVRSVLLCRTKSLRWRILCLPHKKMSSNDFLPGSMRSDQMHCSQLVRTSYCACVLTIMLGSCGNNQIYI